VRPGCCGPFGQSSGRSFGMPPHRGGRRPAAAAKEVTYDQNIVGRLVDVTYNGNVHRMRVKAFDETTGCHVVDSSGFSTWQGKVFTDLLEVAAAETRGKLTFVSEMVPAGKRGAGRPAGKKGATPRGQGVGRSAQEQAPSVELLGPELLGRVLELTYMDMRPPTKYRVRVTGYIPSHGWHKVDSEGLDLWEGESFNDTVDLNAMSQDNCVRILAPDEARKASRRAAPQPVVPSGKPRRVVSAAADKPAVVPGGKRPKVASAAAAQPGGKRQKVASEPAGGRRSAPMLGSEILGRILDLRYSDMKPAAIFRVRVTDFLPSNGWHKVDSKGLSQWMGESFNDTVDLNSMMKNGDVSLVDDDSIQVQPPKSPTRVLHGSTRQRGRGRQAAGGRGRARRSAKAPVADEEAAGPGRASPAWRADPKARIGRIIDITYHNQDGLSTYRVRTVGYQADTNMYQVDSTGYSEVSGHAVAGNINWETMVAAGRLTPVDGNDELQTAGHALVGEEIEFTVDAGPAHDPQQWIKGRIVAWWPQNLVPPIITDSLPDPREVEATFVVPDEAGAKWSIKLSDALMAVSREKAKEGDPPSASYLRCLEVFASTCELSVAMRRFGVPAEAYGFGLNSRHTNAGDNLFIDRLTSGYDLVHFCPPPQGDDGKLWEVLLEVIQKMHSRGLGFVIDTGEAELLEGSVFFKAASLEGVAFIFYDPHDFGGNTSSNTLLLTNRQEWFTSMWVGARRASKLAPPGTPIPARHAEGSSPSTTSAQGAERYSPRFCRDYVQSVIQSMQEELLRRKQHDSVEALPSSEEA